MPKKIDLAALKRKTERSLDQAVDRAKAAYRSDDWDTRFWVYSMIAVEVHALWERYVENRLAAALNHDASYFLAENGFTGIGHVGSAFAAYLVRGGNKYFDFRSMSDLLTKADRLLGKDNDPFRQIKSGHPQYLDVLAVVRNHVVHGSDAAIAAYKARLRTVYGIKSAPKPGEFLFSKDNRKISPNRRRSRLNGLITVVKQAISDT